MNQRCAHCAHELAPGAEYCTNCGTRPNPQPPAVDATQVIPAASEPQWGQYPQAPVYGEQPQYAQQPPQYAQQPPQFVEPVAPAKRGVGKFVGLGLGVVGLLAIGFLALRFLMGGGSTGGASSPDAVVTEMVVAINAQDPLAMVDLMAPDELDGFDTLISDLTDYYNDLGLAEIAAAQGDSTDGIEVTVELEADRVEVRMEGDEAAVVSFELSGRLQIDGGTDGMLDSLDLGDDLSFDSRDLEGALPNGSDQVDLIAIKLDGRWYLSPMLTVGHYIIENSDLPRGDYGRIGADREPGGNTPADAVQALVDVINDPDADALAAALGGGEGRVATVFRDAIDEGFRSLDTSDTPYELTVRTSDAGDGVVNLDEIDFTVDDSFLRRSIVIEDGCAVLREDGERVDEGCIVDAFDIDELRDIDTTLFLETVDEDGGQRVRIIPSVTGLLGRFVGVIDDRQTLLYTLDLVQFDTATTAAVNTDIDITFDGQLYSVNEFPVEAGEYYSVTVSGDSGFDLWVDDGFGLFQKFGGDFLAEEDGMARVAVYSDFDFSCDSGTCPPTGEGSATLRIRQAVRQDVPFPQNISGDLGPGDIRVFDLVVESGQVVRLDVSGDTVSWFLEDAFLYSVDEDTFDLPPGTYQLVVYNRSGDDPTSYAITPSGG